MRRGLSRTAALGRGGGADLCGAAEAQQVRTVLTPCFVKSVDLAGELAHVTELPIFGKADVGDRSMRHSFAHDPRADLGRFISRSGRSTRLDAIGDPFELLHADGTLLARAHEAADELLAAERLGTAVLLDHTVLDLLDVLAARVALAAAKALAAPANAVAFLALARVHDLVAEMPAEGTLHDAAGSFCVISRMRPNERPSRAMNTRPSSVTGRNEMACSTIAAPTAVGSGTPKNVVTAILYAVWNPPT
jgi:hypothetical protein